MDGCGDGRMDEMYGEHSSYLENLQPWMDGRQKGAALAF